LLCKKKSLELSKTAFVSFATRIPTSKYNLVVAAQHWRLFFLLQAVWQLLCILVCFCHFVLFVLSHLSTVPLAWHHFMTFYSQ
jgi:uncharacterized protein involved in response to NO